LASTSLTSPPHTAWLSVGGSTAPIGVLALQGDVAEHRRMLEHLGVDVVDVRQCKDLTGISGLVIPGGESTVMDKLTRIFGLQGPLRELIAQGMPVLGTCAGMIMLANSLEDGISGQETLGGLDVTVKRNAFGSQKDSFDVALDVQGVEGGSVDVSFIRAPTVTRHGDTVRVLATLPGGQIVACEEGNILALSFHPEVTGDTRLHKRFLATVEREQFQAEPVCEG
jgi:pyridoxal 5'-phosphate synthase pdxT subunit